MTLARTRVPLDRPLTPCIDDEELGAPSKDHSWKELVDVLENARGCNFAACGRVAEDPETVLFIIGRLTECYPFVHSLTQNPLQPGGTKNPSTNFKHHQTTPCFSCLSACWTSPNLEQMAGRPRHLRRR